jgi:hypothetical protein
MKLDLRLVPNAIIAARQASELWKRSETGEEESLEPGKPAQASATGLSRHKTSLSMTSGVSYGDILVVAEEWPSG